jgi:hypothetical protein
MWFQVFVCRCPCGEGDRLPFIDQGEGGFVSAIKPYEGFGDVDHTIKELMSL